MIVYLDVLLIENFLINFFLIVVSIQLLRFKFKYRRVIIASILGSVYTLTILFENLHMFTLIPFKILIVLFMLLIVIGKRSIITFCKSIAIFFVVSIAFSGFCFVFAMAENPYNITGAFTIKNYSSKYLLFSLIILYISSFRIYAFFKERAIINNFLYKLEFELNGEQVNTMAFLDTGNELVEPATMLPVIILEKQVIAKCNIDDKKYFYIPYKSVDGITNRMKGIKVHDIKLENNSGHNITSNVIIAICDTKLSADGDFNALLSRGVI